MAEIKVTDQQEFENGRNQAIAFAWVVYGGVVVAATTLFISFVLIAFPEGAYFSRTVMTVAGALVGASMIAFPFALHKWTVEKGHRRWTIFLYYGEMLIIAVNTLVSFASLLSKNTGIKLPEWVILYEPFAIISIVYTLAAWGTVFLTDPRHKAIVKGLEAMQTFDDKVADRLAEFVDSIEGRQVIQKTAENKIAQMFDAEKFNITPKSFTGDNLSQNATSATQTRQDAPQPVAMATIPENVYKQLLQDAAVYGSNGNGANPTNR